MGANGGGGVVTIYDELFINDLSNKYYFQISVNVVVYLLLWNCSFLATRQYSFLLSLDSRGLYGNQGRYETLRSKQKK